MRMGCDGTSLSWGMWNEKYLWHDLWFDLYALETKTPKSFFLNHPPPAPQLAKIHVSWEEWGNRNKAILFFFQLPCIDTLQLYQNEEGGRDISLSESHATAAADAVSAILLGHKVGLFIGPNPAAVTASAGRRSIGRPLFTYDYYWSSAQMTYQ